MSENRRTVDALARDLGATILYDAKDAGGYEGPRADPRTRTVHALPVENATPELVESGFWVILHELGHLAHNHHGRDAWERMFGIGGASEAEGEAEAWKWAIEHAGRPLTPLGAADAKFALASYLHTNGVARTVIGPNLRWAIETLGHAPLERDAVEATYGPEQARYLDLANQAWAAAVRKADIKDAA